MKRPLIIILSVLAIYIHSCSREVPQETILDLKLEPIAKSESFNERLSAWRSPITVDHWNNVFALISFNQKIVILDTNLQMVRKFGIRGEGPGEFLMPSNISVDRHGNLMVVDIGWKLNLFYNNGDFKKLIKSRVMNKFVDVRYLSDGIFALICLGSKHSGYVSQTINIRKETIINEFYLEDVDFVLKVNEGFLATYPPFLGRHTFLDDNDGFCILGESQRFWLKLFGPQGQVITTIEKEIKRQELSNKEIDYMVQLINYSTISGFREKTIRKSVEKYKYKNTIHEIKIDQGLIFVFTVPEDITIKNKFPADIYDFNGKYLGHAVFPQVPAKIKNGYSYCIEIEEEWDTQIIVKYKMILPSSWTQK